MKFFFPCIALFFLSGSLFSQKPANSQLELAIPIGKSISKSKTFKKVLPPVVADFLDTLSKDTAIEIKELLFPCLIEIDNSVTFKDIGTPADECFKKGIDPETGLSLYVDEKGNWQYENDVVNVRHFGAKGDDVTDDTEAIKIALRYACNNATLNGRSVYFPKGIYRTSEAIRGQCDGLVIYGDSDASVIKPLKDWISFPDERGIIGGYGTLQRRVLGVVIRDLKVDGTDFSYFDTNIQQNGVVLGYSENSKVENVHVTGIENYGIWFRESENGEIIRNFVDGAEESIEVSQNVDGCKIMGNYVKANEVTQNMVLLYGNAQNIQADNNRLEGKAYGFAISESFGGCKNVTMSNNIVKVSNKESGASVSCYLIDENTFDEEENFSIQGGVASAKNASVIRIQNKVKNLEISGVTILSESGFAIEAVESETLIISDNILKTGKGIDTYSSSDIIIKGNIIEHSGRGKVGSKNSENLIIEANTIKQADVVIGGNGILSNNTYFPNGIFNFYVHNDNNIIKGNVCVGDRTLNILGSHSIVHDNIIGAGVINDEGEGNSIEGNLKN